MLGLEKYDTSHLTPKGLVEHGERLFETWRQLTKSGVSPHHNHS